MGVHCNPILGSITNQTLIVGEGHIGWCCAVTLVVRDDLYTIILPYTDAAGEKQMVSIGWTCCQTATQLKVDEEIGSASIQQWHNAKNSRVSWIWKCLGNGWVVRTMQHRGAASKNNISKIKNKSPIQNKLWKSHIVEVHRDLILGGITHQSLVIEERHIKWRRAAIPVVRDGIILLDQYNWIKASNQNDWDC